MNRERVVSSDLAEVGYDQETSRLEIMFKAGAIYEYENVPQEVHSELMAAGSKGSYFNRFIRNRYPTRRLQ